MYACICVCVNKCVCVHVCVCVGGGACCPACSINAGMYELICVHGMCACVTMHCTHTSAEFAHDFEWLAL